MKKRTMKTLLMGAAVATMMLGTSVCAEESVEVETEAYTGDVSLDNTRNQDEIGEKELLVVSFGTSFNENRALTVGAVEAAMEEAFPEWAVRRGFTSQIIIDHVKERDGVAIDNVTEALDRAVENGVKTLVVQPTHLMNGIEYDELTQTLAEYADAFETVAVGEPLLMSEEDFATVEKAITEWTAEYDDGETAIVFMGHGTHHEANAVYGKLQENLTGNGFENYFIGTVEGSPSLDDVMALVEAGEYKKVVLSPLMIVAGDHANNDMASLEDGAWRKVFEDAGYEVEVLLRGLGENAVIQDLLVAHAQAAIDSLAE